MIAQQRVLFTSTQAKAYFESRKTKRFIACARARTSVNIRKTPALPERAHYRHLKTSDLKPTGLFAYSVKSTSPINNVCQNGFLCAYVLNA